MYKIGSGLQPEELEPATGRGKGRSVKYPIAELSVGEHFAVPLVDKDEKARLRKVRSLQRSISRHRKDRPGLRCLVRYSPDDNALYVIRLEDDLP